MDLQCIFIQLSSVNINCIVVQNHRFWAATLTDASNLSFLWSPISEQLPALLSIFVDDQWVCWWHQPVWCCQQTGGRDAIQWNLDRFERWVHVNVLGLRGGPMWTSWSSSWLGQFQAQIQAGCRMDWEQHWGEGLRDVKGRKAHLDLVMCSCSPESRKCLDLQVLGGDSAPSDTGKTRSCESDERNCLLLPALALKSNCWRTVVFWIVFELFKWSCLDF